MDRITRFTDFLPIFYYINKRQFFKLLSRISDRILALRSGRLPDIKKGWLYDPSFIEILIITKITIISLYFYLSFLSSSGAYQIILLFHLSLFHYLFSSPSALCQSPTIFLSIYILLSHYLYLSFLFLYLSFSLSITFFLFIYIFLFLYLYLSFFLSLSLLTLPHQCRRSARQRGVPRPRRPRPVCPAFQKSK